MGSLGFVENVKKELGVRAMRRQATETDGTFTLREPEEGYSDVFAGENDALRPDNRQFWNETRARTAT